jgi:formate-dependent nitrite reductase membrane component NrfD
MTLLKGLGTGLCLTVLCLIVAPKAKADEWNHKTVITFSGPVEVPGVGQHLLAARHSFQNPQRS